MAINLFLCRHNFLKKLTYLVSIDRIKHTYILEDPFDDPPQLAELVPDASPEGKPKDEVITDSRSHNRFSLLYPSRSLYYC